MDNPLAHYSARYRAFQARMDEILDRRIVPRKVIYAMVAVNALVYTWAIWQQVTMS